MEIKSKFLYAKTKLAFERELANIPENLNPIAFIEDTKELWTHGTYFSIGYPSLLVSEVQGSVKLSIGDSGIYFEAIGNGLTVTKAANDRILFSSTALVNIDTQAPLYWDNQTKKLLHSESSVTSGSYGPSSSINNASTFYIPYITIDKYGHVSSVKNSTLSIRDYVEQLTPSSTDADKNILLSYNESNNNSDTAQVRKARGLYYNDALQLLKVAGGINAGGNVTVTNGNLTVIGGTIIGDLQGNVTGQATPKIHLSNIPEYGGASTELYGHVKLQDILISEPQASSNNTNPSSADVTLGVAASPKMVWDVRQGIMVDLNALNQKIDNKPYVGGFVVGSDTLQINEVNQQISIIATGGISVSIENGGFIVKTPDIKMYDTNENEKTISTTLKFSKDFTENSDDEIEIRWTEFNN